MHKEPLVDDTTRDSSTRGGYKSSYFDAHAIHALKTYKYIGEDQGLMYKFFYGPVANKLVTYIPHNIA
jgi:hypothetical protein